MPACRVGVSTVWPGTIEPSGPTNEPVTRAGAVSAIRTVMNDRCSSQSRRTVMIRIASLVETS